MFIMDAGIHIVILLKLVCTSGFTPSSFTSAETESKTAHGAWDYYALFHEVAAAPPRDVRVKSQDESRHLNSWREEMPELVLKKVKSLNVSSLKPTLKHTV